MSFLLIIHIFHEDYHLKCVQRNSEAANADFDISVWGTVNLMLAPLYIKIIIYIDRILNGIQASKLHFWLKSER